MKIRNIKNGFVEIFDKAVFFIKIPIYRDVLRNG